MRASRRRSHHSVSIGHVGTGAPTRPVERSSTPLSGLLALLTPVKLPRRIEPDASSLSSALSISELAMPSNPPKPLAVVGPIWLIQPVTRARSASSFDGVAWPTSTGAVSNLPSGKNTENVLARSVATQYL